MIIDRESNALSRSVMSNKSSHSSLKKSPKKVGFAPDLNNVINQAQALNSINQRDSRSKSKDGGQ